MNIPGCRLSLKYRLIFYTGGFVFAFISYMVGLWAYEVESVGWGEIALYRAIARNLVDTFQSHRLTFFLWELVCTGIALTIGYLFDREVYYRQKAEERANIDGLTGLYNHRYFQERLTAEIERAARYDRTLSLIILDIDDFKLFNDTWGHQEGDKLLTLFAALCARCVRAMDVIARYGGEEFVIIMPETSSEEALAAAERIREYTEKQTASVFGRNRGATVSAGIASYPEHGTSRHALILNADAALYFAKQRGKNRCYIYEQDHHRLYRAASSHVHSSPIDDDFQAIEALGASVDALDKYSRGHSQNVMQLSVALGEKLGLSAEEIGNLRVAALLHDLGKVGTPRELREKTEPLSKEEWVLLRDHAGLGSRILKRVQQMKSIGPGIKHHHERFDGTGYPNGLAGPNIPLMARVIAIADAYDAMVSERPYRKAKTREEAIEELRRCAGTQFDPELVEVFIKMLEEESQSSGEEKAA